MYLGIVNGDSQSSSNAYFEISEDQRKQNPKRNNPLCKSIKSNWYALLHEEVRTVYIL